MNKILETDISYFNKYYDISHGAYYSYLLGDNEHYKLLTWLSMQLPDDSIVLDIGTNYGHSSLALAQNPNVTVLSFDTEDKRILFREDYPNITFHIQDAMTISDEVLLSAKLIVFDTDHDGAVEKRFFDRLMSLNYSGIVIWDDISLNDGMKEFWGHTKDIIRSNKVDQMLLLYDITNIGHFTGTGLIAMNLEPKAMNILFNLGLI